MLKQKLGTGMTRRDFGKLAGVGGLALGVSPAALRGAFAAGTMDSSEIITGKHKGMLVHNAKLGVMETPLDLLRQYKHTPKEILYNRLHFPHEGSASWYATTAAPKWDEWTIRLDGLVKRPRTVKLKDLAAMPQEKRVSVLQCAGNGRSFYAAKQKVAGGQWINGGMGNVEWEGVPLRPFIEAQKMEIGSAATWLTAEGWDQPATPVGTDFSKSYKLDDPALDHAILALKMNGEPIPAVHGGPVRLIIPGYYGNMNVKFLNVLLFAAAQSPSTYQSMAYRFPNFPVEPGKFEANDYTLDNSRPTYGHQIKSVIFSPLPEDGAKPGAVEIKGVAFNDGVAKITKVEVSADDGKTWMDADVAEPESPWAWYHWTAKAKLAKGKNILMCRATDALGRTQPIDGLVRWNPRGYEWNGVYKLEIEA